MPRKHARLSSSFSKTWKGFSLDDYLPFADVTAGLGALRNFLASDLANARHDTERRMPTAFLRCEVKVAR